jgi:hypothetical protein
VFSRTDQQTSRRETSKILIYLYWYVISDKGVSQFFGESMTIKKNVFEKLSYFKLGAMPHICIPANWEERNGVTAVQGQS